MFHVMYDEEYISVNNVPPVVEHSRLIVFFFGTYINMFEESLQYL